MNRAVVGIAAALAGCSLSAKINGTGPGPTPSGGGGSTAAGAGSTASGGGSITVPDLTGLTAAQAEAALRAAGFVGRIERPDGVCGEGDDTRMAAKDTVCFQEPHAGVVTPLRSVTFRLTVQRDDPDHGGVGSGAEWRRMPDLLGKPMDVARTILARASLPLDDQFEVIEVEDETCQSGVVCRTEPEARRRKVLGARGRIYVGAPRVPVLPQPAPPAAATQPTYF